MAAALQAFASCSSPSRNTRPAIRRTTAPLGLPCLPASCHSRFQSRHIQSSAIVPALSPSIHGRCLQIRQFVLDRRFPIHVTFAAPQEDSMCNDGDSGKDELEIKTNESLKAWKQMLESFKEESLKMRSVSQEAYDVYSKRALELLKETSEKIKIQSDQARDDLSKLAEVMSEEGKEYLSTAAENSPESVRDIVETFASSPDEVKKVSEVREFYLGIPYGGLLVIAGFLHFMLTGSLSGIRFGVILGGILLALSVCSLRACKSGQSSTIFLKGQAAITTIIFIREWNLLSQRLSFPSIFTTLLSGAMLAFYIYRIIIDGQNKGPSFEQAPKN